MADSALAPLMANAGLLLTLVVLLDVAAERAGSVRPAFRSVVLGLAIGALGVAVMAVPFILRPGLVFDVRSVVLALSGFFFGPAPTAMAMAVTAGFRWWEGGLGTAVGIAVIAASGGIGLLWRRRPPALRIGRLADLYLLGLVVHLVMLGLMLALPAPSAGLVMSQVAGPVLLVYPLATLAVGLLLDRRRQLATATTELVESEARFRGLFEDSHAIMLVIDPSDGTIVDANAAAIDFYGWSRAELTAMRIDQVNTLTPDEIKAAMERARRKGGRSFEFVHRRADGSTRVVEVFSGPIRHAGRDLLYSLIIDVHDRRRAEAERASAAAHSGRAHVEALERQRRERIAALNLADDARAAQQRAEQALARLAASEGRLRLLIDHVPAGLAMFDRDMRYLVVSRRLLADFGREGRDVVGQCHYDVFPEIPEHWRDSHRRALQGEVVRAEEDRFVGADGGVMWRRWEVRPWFMADGAVGGIVLFTEDVTEVVRARGEVGKLSQAVEQSPESIVITDLEGRIEYVNEAYVEASGYAREELLGQNPRLLKSGKTPRATYDAMWAALTRGDTWKGEFINRRKDGSEYVEFATISPLTSADGETTHYVAVKEDITEKQRLARELDRYRFHLEEEVSVRTAELHEARERADAANQAKSTFLANMSHEIRTPISAIVGLTHLLLRDQPPPAQRERLRKVESAAGHLLSIVTDVLDLAKIEAGKLAVDARDFHLSAVLDHVRSMIAETARAKGLTVTVDPDAVPMWLRGDPVRLRQALLNLAGNAVKFTEEGSVHLSAELLGDVGRDLRVRFAVTDTGIGIAADGVPKLFEAFEQGDPSITRAYGGSGLGLVITRRLAELMGGEVGVESEPGRGTRFWFTVVVERGRGVMPVGDEVEVEEPGALRDVLGARVLLAEDNDINREVASELLHGFGLDVATAATGRAAVEAARSEAFDLVLMDVQMPELDGLSATREIRRLPGYDRVPILAMTANVFEEDRRACFAAGMDDFVAKPVDPTTLRAVLVEWIGRRAGGSTAALPTGVQPAAPGAPASPDTRQLLLGPASEGLDPAFGLRATGGDPRRYLDLMGRFVTAHAADARHLVAALSAGDAEAARQRAHALKGVAGTLGATALQSAAADLELAIREERPADAFVPALARELEAVQRWVAEAVASLAAENESDSTVGSTAAPPEASPGRERADATAVLAELERLVAVSDPQAVEHFARHRTALRAALGEAAEGVERDVGAYDFERAAARVHAAMRGRGTDPADEA